MNTKKDLDYWMHQWALARSSEFALMREVRELKAAIRKTLSENGHLADGENCTGGEAMTDYMDLIAKEKIDVMWWKTSSRTRVGEFNVTLVLSRPERETLQRRLDVDTAEARAAALRELLSVIAEEKA